MLRDAFLNRPEKLKSESTVDGATTIEVGNYQEVIWHIVEKKIHELSYSPAPGIDTFRAKKHSRQR